jgi:hypothetical protein
MSWYKPEEFVEPLPISQYMNRQGFIDRTGFMYGVRWKCMILYHDRLFCLETTNYDRILSFIERSIEEDIPCKIYALESGKFFIEENSGGNIDVG